MKKIMFVDDEPEILAGIRRMLRGRRKQWDMEFVEGGPAALRRIEQDSFHVIVTDMRMPMIDGAELLEKVRQISPATVRIMLSGHSEKTSIMRSVRPAHQYLAKPVEKDRLEEVLEKSLNLNDLLADNNLTALLTQVESLPALPQIFERLMAEIESDDCSLKKVGDLIGKDMGMTATILKVVNSAFFGLPRMVSDPSQAVALLGVDTIKALVLSYQLFSTRGQAKLKGFSFEQLWNHSLNTGGFAKAIAQCEGWTREKVEEAFLTGMLHDVGKLTLMTVASERYAAIVNKVRKGGGLLQEVESETLGTTHGEAGAYLLGLWGFGSDVIHAIGMHHRPRPFAGGKPDLLTVVYAANVLEHELVIIHPGYAKPRLDAEYLESMGAMDRIELWRSSCQQLIQKGEKDAKNPSS